VLVVLLSEDVKVWQARPLDALYPILYLDCIHVKVRDTGAVRNIYGVRLWIFPSTRGLFRHRGKYVKRIVNKRSWNVKVWKFINPPSC
jgi:hypothetical protein